MTIHRAHDTKHIQQRRTYVWNTRLQHYQHTNTLSISYQYARSAQAKNKHVIICTYGRQRRTIN